MHAKKILALKPDPIGFSGQRAAAQMTVDAINADTRFRCTVIDLPGLPKGSGRATGYTIFLFKSLKSVSTFIFLSIFFSWDGLFVALSQTRKTLAREKLLIGWFKWFNRGALVVFRLDSSLFTHWKGDEIVAQKLRKLLGTAAAISVLGPEQRSVLRSRFSCEKAKTFIIPNTCEFECYSETRIRAKHLTDGETGILHLGSLMEPKGYSNLIDSIPLLSSPTKVIVCGQLATTVFDKRFRNIEAQEQFKTESIEKYSNLQWIDGASGAAKFSLFERAHIFVLPTSFFVEAQPLVLLEAMATGCVIVTTLIGEIPFMVNTGNAVILEDTAASTIAAAVNRLINNRTLRLELALSARETFLEKFSVAQHDQNWQKLFEDNFLTGSEKSN